MSCHTTTATRFDSFNLYRTSYKKIGDHDIEVNVLVPIEITPGKNPVMVKWHGGGLPSCQNYRLTPEHTGDEILEDIADFWTWFKSSLPAYVASKTSSIEVDFSKVRGESPCLVQYPVINAVPTSPDETQVGQAIPSKEVLEESLAAIIPGKIISSAIPPARSWLAPMLRAHRRWDEFFGKGKHLMPDTRLQDAKYFVPTYIIHGADDSNVPLKYTHAFIEKAKKLLRERRFKLVTLPGDHGFDVEIYEEDEPWLEELLKGVEEDWLA